VAGVDRKSDYMLDFCIGADDVKEGVFKCNEVCCVQKLVSGYSELALGGIGKGQRTHTCLIPESLADEYQGVSKASSHVSLFLTNVNVNVYVRVLLKLPGMTASFWVLYQAHVALVAFALKPAGRAFKYVESAMIN
jgi:hypothetical protein